MSISHSLTEPGRKALRLLRRALAATRSSVAVAWYQVVYADLVIGKRVTIGKGARLHVVRGGRLVIGSGTNIEPNCDVVAEGILQIGPRSFLGAGTIIVAVERVSIGADALIAAYTTIRDHDHRIELGKPFNSQGLISAPIDIEDNVWIGTKATILKGVHIGRDAVVGAHALVTGDVEACSVVGGVPARVLRKLVPVQPEGRA